METPPTNQTQAMAINPEKELAWRQRIRGPGRALGYHRCKSHS